MIWFVILLIAALLACFYFSECSHCKEYAEKEEVMRVRLENAPDYRRKYYVILNEFQQLQLELHELKQAASLAGLVSEKDREDFGVWRKAKEYEAKARAGIRRGQHIAKVNNDLPH